MTDSAAAVDTLHEELNEDNNAMCVLYASVAGTKYENQYNLCAKDQLT